jgi:hypothetical protein
VGHHRTDVELPADFGLREVLVTLAQGTFPDIMPMRLGKPSGLCPFSRSVAHDPTCSTTSFVLQHFFVLRSKFLITIGTTPAIWGSDGLRPQGLFMTWSTKRGTKVRHPHPGLGNRSRDPISGAKLIVRVGRRRRSWAWPSNRWRRPRLQRPSDPAFPRRGGSRSTSPCDWVPLSRLKFHDDLSIGVRRDDSGFSLN